MSAWTVVLWAWSGAAGIWWLLAILLVRFRPRTHLAPEPEPLPSLTVFKPLPPVGDAPTRQSLTEAVESFLTELGPADELLLGIPADSLEAWQPALSKWRSVHPSVRIRELVRETPRQHANPKVAWLEHLAPLAQGTVWLWSDADILAPPGFLTLLRRESQARSGEAMTSVYCIRSVAAAPGLLDALFVNTDFLPGARLLGRLGPVRLAFGAAILFRAEDFRRTVDWNRLGACLADDYAVGQFLGRVHISSQMVETFALQTRWSAALRHLYRWQKTIRWCRPGSFAALLFIHPLIGWLLVVLIHPTHPQPWIGLISQWTLEAVVAGVILAEVGFRNPRRYVLGIALWPLIRVLGWLAAWLPVPVWWDRNPWKKLTNQLRVE